ncbi:MAG: dephospho-CoA kinase [Bacteroidetes bacterium]|nr:dephospho-CoA kinase [Bacteroidota bacterium]
MLRIGLTGGIGSGKSTVARIFQTLGIPIYSADIEAKRLMREDESVRSAIQLAFGADIYTNELPDTRRLASIVFNDPVALEKLNQIIHPATIADAKKWMQAQQAPYVIKESALLFESGATEGLDLVVGVYAPQALRIQRVMQRESVNRETVLARMSRQVEEEIKRRLCDRVIINDEQQPLLQQVLDLHQELLELSKQA